MKYIPTVGIFIGFWLIFSGVGSYINFPTPQNVMQITFGLFAVSLCLQTINFEAMETKIQNQEDNLTKIFKNIFTRMEIYNKALNIRFISRSNRDEIK